MNNDTKMQLLHYIAREGLVIKHAINWCDNYEPDPTKKINQLLEEYKLASPYPSLTKGMEIAVFAWWTTPVAKPCKCRVIDDPYLDITHNTKDHPEQWYVGIKIQPLEGNNHVRYIDTNDIIRD